jgi:hypothetical protein
MAAKTEGTNALCIYPGPHSDSMSDEHDLPQALGTFEGQELLRDKLCGACNGHIGEIEEAVLRTGYIGVLRWHLGIKGKDGLPPPPFRRGASGTPRAQALGNPDGLPVLFECFPGTKTGIPLRQVIFRTDDPASFRPLYIPDWMLEKPTEFRDALRREGLEQAMPVRGFSHPDESPKVAALLESAGLRPPEKWNWEGAEFAPHRETVTIAAPIPMQEFCRFMAKIAFHYTLRMFSDLTGREHEFRSVRKFIWEGGDNHFVEPDYPNPVRPPKVWSHFLTVARSYEKIVATVHLFVPPLAVMRAIPPQFRVRVGIDPSRVVRPVERRAHQFAMSRLGTLSGPIGEVVDLMARAGGP